ncbi:MAG: tetratricopeptide repeat protein, partial [Bacteroidota bacterium]
MRPVLLICFFILAASTTQAQYKLYADGLEKYNQKDYLGAVELLSEFLTRPVRDKKYDVDAHYWRGLASFKLNDFEASVEDLQEALKLKHANVGNIHWFIAKGHHALRHYPQAIESYDAAVALFAKDNVRKAQLLSDRSKSHQAAGKTDLARTDLQNALKLQPGIAEVERQLRELDGTPPVTENKPVITAQQQPKPEEKKPAEKIETAAQQPVSTTG